MSERADVSTILMYAGMGIFIASLPIASLAGEATGGYGGAVVMLGLLVLGAAAFAALAIPAAIHSWLAARRDPGRDSNGGKLARAFVAATFLIGVLLAAKHLA